jgi:hypothetical protein
MANYEGNRYELRRETSQYNKYMKWHVLYFNAEGFNFVSLYYKTRREAEQVIEWDKAKGIIT